MTIEEAKAILAKDVTPNNHYAIATAGLFENKARQAMQGGATEDEAVKKALDAMIERLPIDFKSAFAAKIGN